MAAIAEIARREGIERLVLGEPVSLDGSRGPAAARVRRFGARLAARTALPLSFVDEALTSVEAAARLRAAGVDPRRHPERIDATAAQILLQEDLDRAMGESRGERSGRDDPADSVGAGNAGQSTELGRGEGEPGGAGEPGEEA
jgi:putative Holliday junction resolvase